MDLVEELVNLVDLVDPDKLFEATVVSESGAWCYPDLSLFLTVILKNLSSFSVKCQFSEHLVSNRGAGELVKLADLLEERAKMVDWLEELPKLVDLWRSWRSWRTCWRCWRSWWTRWRNW